MNWTNTGDLESFRNELARLFEGKKGHSVSQYQKGRGSIDFHVGEHSYRISQSGGAIYLQHGGERYGIMGEIGLQDAAMDSRYKRPTAALGELIESSLSGGGRGSAGENFYSRFMNQVRQGPFSRPMPVAQAAAEYFMGTTVRGVSNPQDFAKLGNEVNDYWGATPRDRNDERGEGLVAINHSAMNSLLGVYRTEGGGFSIPTSAAKLPKASKTLINLEHMLPVDSNYRWNTTPLMLRAEGATRGNLGEFAKLGIFDQSVPFEVGSGYHSISGVTRGVGHSKEFRLEEMTNTAVDQLLSNWQSYYGKGPQGSLALFDSDVGTRVRIEAPSTYGGGIVPDQLTIGLNEQMFRLYGNKNVPGVRFEQSEANTVNVGYKLLQRENSRPLTFKDSWNKANLHYNEDMMQRLTGGRANVAISTEGVKASDVQLVMGLQAALQTMNPQLAGMVENRFGLQRDRQGYMVYDEATSGNAIRAAKALFNMPGNELSRENNLGIYLQNWRAKTGYGYEAQHTTAPITLGRVSWANTGTGAMAGVTSENLFAYLPTDEASLFQAFERGMPGAREERTDAMRGAAQAMVQRIMQQQAAARAAVGPERAAAIGSAASRIQNLTITPGGVVSGQWQGEALFMPTVTSFRASVGINSNHLSLQAYSYMNMAAPKAAEYILNQARNQPTQNAYQQITAAANHRFLTSAKIIDIDDINLSGVHTAALGFAQQENPNATQYSAMHTIRAIDAAALAAAGNDPNYMLRGRTGQIVPSAQTIEHFTHLRSETGEPVSALPGSYINYVMLHASTPDRNRGAQTLSNAGGTLSSTMRSLVYDVEGNMQGGFNEGLTQLNVAGKFGGEFGIANFLESGEVLMGQGQLRTFYNKMLRNGGWGSEPFRYNDFLRSVQAGEQFVFAEGFPGQVSDSTDVQRIVTPEFLRRAGRLPDDFYQRSSAVPRESIFMNKAWATKNFRDTDADQVALYGIGGMTKNASGQWISDPEVRKEWAGRFERAYNWVGSRYGYDMSEPIAASLASPQSEGGKHFFDTASAAVGGFLGKITGRKEEGGRRNEVSQGALMRAFTQNAIGKQEMGFGYNQTIAAPVLMAVAERVNRSGVLSTAENKQLLDALGGGYQEAVDWRFQSGAYAALNPLTKSIVGKSGDLVLPTTDTEVYMDEGELKSKWSSSAWKSVASWLPDALVRTSLGEGKGMGAPAEIMEKMLRTSPGVNQPLVDFFKEVGASGLDRTKYSDELKGYVERLGGMLKLNENMDTFMTKSWLGQTTTMMRIGTWLGNANRVDDPRPLPGWLNEAGDFGELGLALHAFRAKMSPRGISMWGQETPEGQMRAMAVAGVPGASQVYESMASLPAYHMGGKMNINLPSIIEDRRLALANAQANTTNGFIPDDLKVRPSSLERPFMDQILTASAGWDVRSRFNKSFIKEIGMGAYIPSLEQSFGDSLFEEENIAAIQKGKMYHALLKRGTEQLNEEVAATLGMNTKDVQFFRGKDATVVADWKTGAQGTPDIWQQESDVALIESRMDEIRQKNPDLASKLDMYYSNDAWKELRRKANETGVGAWIEDAKTMGHTMFAHPQGSLEYERDRADYAYQGATSSNVSSKQLTKERDKRNYSNPQLGLYAKGLLQRLGMGDRKAEDVPRGIAMNATFRTHNPDRPVQFDEMLTGAANRWMAENPLASERDMERFFDDPEKIAAYANAPVADLTNLAVGTFARSMQVLNDQIDTPAGRRGLDEYLTGSNGTAGAVEVIGAVHQAARSIIGLEEGDLKRMAPADAVRTLVERVSNPYVRVQLDMLRQQFETMVPGATRTSVINTMAANQGDWMPNAPLGGLMQASASDAHLKSVDAIREGASQVVMDDEGGTVRRGKRGRFNETTIGKIIAGTLTEANKQRYQFSQEQKLLRAADLYSPNEIGTLLNQIERQQAGTGEFVDFTTRLAESSKFIVEPGTASEVMLQQIKLAQGMAGPTKLFSQLGEVIQGQELKLKQETAGVRQEWLKEQSDDIKGKLPSEQEELFLQSPAGQQFASRKAAIAQLSSQHKVLAAGYSNFQGAELGLSEDIIKERNALGTIMKAGNAPGLSTPEGRANWQATVDEFTKKLKDATAGLKQFEDGTNKSTRELQRTVENVGDLAKISRGVRSELFDREVMERKAAEALSLRGDLAGASMRQASADFFMRQGQGIEETGFEEAYGQASNLLAMRTAGGAPGPQGVRGWLEEAATNRRRAAGMFGGNMGALAFGIFNLNRAWNYTMGTMGRWGQEYAEGQQSYSQAMFEQGGNLVPSPEMLALRRQATATSYATSMMGASYSRTWQPIMGGIANAVSKMPPGMADPLTYGIGAAGIGAVGQIGLQMFGLGSFVPSLLAGLGSSATGLAATTATGAIAGGASAAGAGLAIGGGIGGIADLLSKKEGFSQLTGSGMGYMQRFAGLAKLIAPPGMALGINAVEEVIGNVIQRSPIKPPSWMYNGSAGVSAGNPTQEMIRRVGQKTGMAENDAFALYQFMSAQGITPTEAQFEQFAFKSANLPGGVSENLQNLNSIQSNLGYVTGSPNATSMVMSSGQQSWKMAQMQAGSQVFGQVAQGYGWDWQASNKVLQDFSARVPNGLDVPAYATQMARYFNVDSFQNQIGYLPGIETPTWINNLMGETGAGLDPNGLTLLEQMKRQAGAAEGISVAQRFGLSSDKQQKYGTARAQPGMDRMSSYDFGLYVSRASDVRESPLYKAMGKQTKLTIPAGMSLQEETDWAERLQRVQRIGQLQGNISDTNLAGLAVDLQGYQAQFGNTDYAFNRMQRAMGYGEIAQAARINDLGVGGQLGNWSNSLTPQQFTNAGTIASAFSNVMGKEGAIASTIQRATTGVMGGPGASPLLSPLPPRYAEKLASAFQGISPLDQAWGYALRSYLPSSNIANQPGFQPTVDLLGNVPGYYGMQNFQAQISSLGYAQSIAQGAYSVYQNNWQIHNIQREYGGPGLDASRQIFAQGGDTQGIGLATQEYILKDQNQRANFGIQSRQIGLQRAMLGNAREQYRVNREYQVEERDFNWATQLMQREWTREDYGRSVTRFERDFQWGLEDYDRNTRFATGRQRMDLIRQRQRFLVKSDDQRGDLRRQGNRQEELWDRQDERYSKAIEHEQRLNELNEERFRMQEEGISLQEESLGNAKKHYEEMMKLDDQRFKDTQEQQKGSISYLKEINGLEEQRVKLMRNWQNDNNSFLIAQSKALAAQLEGMRLFVKALAEATKSPSIQKALDSWPTMKVLSEGDLYYSGGEEKPPAPTGGKPGDPAQPRSNGSAPRSQPSSAPMNLTVNLVMDETTINKGSWFIDLHRQMHEIDARL